MPTFGDRHLVTSHIRRRTLSRTDGTALTHQYGKLITGEPTDRYSRARQDCYSKVGFCGRNLGHLHRENSTLRKVTPSPSTVTGGVTIRNIKRHSHLEHLPKPT